MRCALHRFYEYCALYLALFMLGAGCLVWSALALPLTVVLPRERALRFGRSAVSRGFRLYLWSLRVFCACRFDLSELDCLRDAGPLIIAPNHPGLLDALMILSRLPDTVCVLKADLVDNVFMGAGARLAGFIRNDLFIGMIRSGIVELQRGYQLLLFPEGTRTDGCILNAFKGSTAIIACRAKVPIQTVIIEADSNFLGKGWPIFKRPDLPMHFRVRLGQRFLPSGDAAHLTEELQSYFSQALMEENPPQPVASPDRRAVGRSARALAS